jgi:hypothetical protein
LHQIATIKVLKYKKEYKQTSVNPIKIKFRFEVGILEITFGFGVFISSHFLNLLKSELK